MPPMLQGPPAAPLASRAGRRLSGAWLFRANGSSLSARPSRPRPIRIRGGAHGRSALLWGMVLFCCGQLVLDLLVERGRPELRDPEYGHKLSRLQARLQEHPERPLVLFLGSSRVGLGVRPEALAAEDHSPLVFNFGLTSAGPVTELLCLRRLLAEGIRPALLVVEVLPALLNQEYPGYGGSDRIHPARLAWADLPRVQEYMSLPSLVDDPGDSGLAHLLPEPEAARVILYGQWGLARLAPAFAHRFSLLSALAPGWVAWENREDFCQTITADGWLPPPRVAVTAADRRRAWERARSDYAWRVQGFRIAALADRALRELLQLCRSERLPVVLLLMPESSEFRSWYTPAARTALQVYLCGLSRDYEVSVIDARGWLADEDFLDGHHLLPAPATEFTHRLDRELLQRWWGRTTHPEAVQRLPSRNAGLSDLPATALLLLPQLVRAQGEAPHRQAVVRGQRNRVQRRQVPRANPLPAFQHRLGSPKGGRPGC